MPCVPQGTTAILARKRSELLHSQSSHEAAWPLLRGMISVLGVQDPAAAAEPAVARQLLPFRRQPALNPAKPPSSRLRSCSSSLLLIHPAPTGQHIPRSSSAVCWHTGAVTGAGSCVVYWTWLSVAGCCVTPAAVSVLLAGICCHNSILAAVGSVNLHQSVVQ